MPEDNSLRRRTLAIAKLKVLVADSSLFMRVALNSALKRLGFEVVATAKDSKEVVDRRLEFKPDIVIIDLAVADVDNFAVIRAMQIGDHPSTVILMIPEELNIPEVIIGAVRAGAIGYITKPLSPEELNAHIRSIVRR